MRVVEVIRTRESIDKAIKSVAPYQPILPTETAERLEAVSKELGLPYLPATAILICNLLHDYDKALKNLIDKAEVPDLF